MQIAVLGIDLGKNSCSVVGLDAAGRVVLRRRLHRDGVVKLAAGLSSCVVAMEACCGAHHLGRLLRDQGHQVRLMSPEYVRPYVKAQKNGVVQGRVTREGRLALAGRMMAPSCFQLGCEYGSKRWRSSEAARERP